ncbi:MAG TPA: hypothetical protein VF629_21165 [Hymenobacter sp.]|jgi:predicted RNA binding protein YcfA (HicA-like mRNA interferase family)|uniref:hypothetical protein n=1 Tax=Hymenobacter sp. TaxID=1898978 RepID=UPI002ED7B6B2
MSQRQKFLARLLSGQHDNDIDFAALCVLLKLLGFTQRIKGSHHLFGKTSVADLLNLQPTTGNKVKPYQAKQVRKMLLDNAAAFEFDSL